MQVRAQIGQRPGGPGRRETPAEIKDTDLGQGRGRRLGQNLALSIDLARHDADGRTGSGDDLVAIQPIDSGVVITKLLQQLP